MIRLSDSSFMVERPSELPNLARSRRLFLDLETTSFDPAVKALNPWKGHRTAGVCVCGDSGPAWYVPVRHTGDKRNLPLGPAMEWLGDLLRADRDWVNHSIKFDAHMAAADGCEFGGRLVDTLTMAKVVDSDRFSYGLGELGDAWLGRGKRRDRVDEWLRNSSPKTVNFGDVPADIVGEYGCEDVLLNRELFFRMSEKMPAQCSGVWETEIRLTSVLYDMEKAGMRVDPRALKVAEAVALGKMCRIEERLNEAVGGIVNPASNDDCFHVLCSSEGLPVLGRTDGGDPSFDADTLKQYLQHPDVHDDQRLTGVIRAMLAHRKLTTLLGLFVRPYQELQVDGLLHPDYNQSVKSGRMSCRRPNMQQLSKEAKALIVPDHGAWFASYDYAQVEFRVIVHYIEDPEAIAAYAADPCTDFHVWVAKMCGIPRGPAKNINFAIGYGGGRDKIVQMLSANMELMADVDAIVSAEIEGGLCQPNDRSARFRAHCRARGREVYELYHRRLPGLKRTSRQAQRALERRGYVYNAYGRHLRLPAKLSWKAFNRIAQSTAADITKERLVATSPRFNPRVRAAGIEQRAVVHDEVLFHGPPEALEGEADYISGEMEAVSAPLRVPITCSRKAGGTNWRDLK